MTARLSASRVVEASADDVFRTVTDLSRLPDWNAAITTVVQQPEHLAHIELTHSLATLEAAAQRSAGTVPGTDNGGNP